MADNSDRAQLAQMTAELDKLARYADEQEKKATQLQLALDSRIVIEQAVGMLAERFTLTVEEAFELLRRAARDSRRDHPGVAPDLTGTRRTPHAVTAALGPI